MGFSRESLSFHFASRGGCAWPELSKKALTPRQVFSGKSSPSPRWGQCFQPAVLVNNQWNVLAGKECGFTSIIDPLTSHLCRVTCPLMTLAFCNFPKCLLLLETQSSVAPLQGRSSKLRFQGGKGRGWNSEECHFSSHQFQFHFAHLSAVQVANVTLYLHRTIYVLGASQWNTTLRFYRIYLYVTFLGGKKSALSPRNSDPILSRVLHETSWLRDNERPKATQWTPWQC